MHKCQKGNVNLPGAKETPRIHSLASVQHYKIEIMAFWKMATSLLETLLLCKCQVPTSGRGSALPGSRMSRRGAQRPRARPCCHAGGPRPPPCCSWADSSRQRHPSCSRQPLRVPFGTQKHLQHGHGLCRGGRRGSGGSGEAPWLRSHCCTGSAALGRQPESCSYTGRDPGASLISNWACASAVHFSLLEQSGSAPFAASGTPALR